MTNEGFTRLNREFYAADPSVYFLDRLMLLALRASKSDALRALAEDGIKWGQIEFGATKRASNNERDPSMMTMPLTGVGMSSPSPRSSCTTRPRP